MTNPNNFQPGQAIDTEDVLNDAMYPRLENESEEDYNARLEKMHAAADAWQQLGQEAPAEAAEESNNSAVDTFRERMQKRVEDGTYTQEEADAKIARAEAMHAEKANAAAAAEQAAAEQAQNDAAYAEWSHKSGQELQEQSDAIANDFAGEQNVNAATGKERKGGLFDQYPRMAGESNEEYGARLHQISEMEKQYLAEHPETAEEAPEEKDAYTKMVEKRLANGDIKQEEADALLARRDLFMAKKEQKKAEEAENQQAQDRYAESAEQAKMEMAERIRQDDPEAIEFLEKHPELRTEMVAAVQKLEELENLEKMNNHVDEKLDKALEERNNIFMAANDDFLGAKEAYDNAKAANEAARAEMKALEDRAKNESVPDEEFAAVEEKIHKTEAEMKDAEKAQEEAQAKKNTISERFDRYEAAIREKQDVFNKQAQERMAARDKFVEQKSADYNSDMEQALAGISEAEKSKADASAKLAELQEKQKNGEAVDEKEMRTLEGQIRIAEFVIKQNEMAIQQIKQNEVRIADEMGGIVNEKLNWNEFYKSYRDDEELINKFFMKDGKFEEERFNKWVREVYEAKKNGGADDEDEEKPEVRSAAKAEADTAKAAEADAAKGLETAEQKGLFAKLKNFFNKNARSKNGAERALKRDGGVTKFKKLAFVALYALTIGLNMGNVMQVQAPTQTPSMDPMTVYAAEANVAGDTETVDNAGETTADNGVDLQQVSENLSLTPDLGAEQGEQDPNIVNTSYSDGTNLEINMDYGDYSFNGLEGSAYFDFENKEGHNNLTPWLYDYENEDLTDAERAEQIQENLNQLADDPTMQGQIAGFMGDAIQIDGQSVTSFSEMRNVQIIAQQDDEFRNLMAGEVQNIYADLAENNTLNLLEVEEGTTYGSLYALNTAEDGEMPRLMYYKDDEVTAHVDFDVLQYLNEDGQNVLDTNEIGGIKYNFLKAAGVIPENATDEEAQEIMSKFKILGISGKCGQVIWRLVNPDSGDETSGKESAGSESVGNESAGNESDGDESAGNESAGNESAGDESAGNESAGNESAGDESAGNESAGNESAGDESAGNESAGNESAGDESAGNESVGDESVGNESVGDENISVGNESVGDESVGDESVGDEGSYDGKTEVYVDEDNDGWTDVDQPTQEETGPTAEAGDGNGYTNDNNPGGSSNVAEDDSLNGGDQGGGDTDSDGGGSTNPDTEATYNGTDTSGWQGNQQSEEPGTQDVQEPSTQEEVNQVNDSEANQNSAGEDTAPGEGANEAMNRLG